MEQTTRILQSRYDNLELSLLEVKPEGELRGVVQLVHGMSEYKERYLPLMEYLAKRGFVCVIHDHRGHGKSVKRTDDLGYMYGGRGDAIVDDIRLVNSYIRYKYNNLPLILFGHSMGSLAVRTFLKKYDRHLSAVIICGSPSKNAALPLGRGILKVQHIVKGPHHKSKIIEGLSFGTYAARFPRDKSRFAWTCAAPEVVEEYESSPLCGFTFTVDGYNALFDLMQETYSPKGWKCLRPDLPILFISGGDDPCMGNIRQFKQAVDFMRFVGYHDVRGKIYPGMRHEILNEHDKEKVYHDIYCFIRRKINR